MYIERERYNINKYIYTYTDKHIHLSGGRERLAGPLPGDPPAPVRGSRLSNATCPTQVFFKSE